MEKKIYGYSERGAVSTLLYEMYYHQKLGSILEDFLKLIHFPLDSNLQLNKKIKSVQIFVEQSFSDFGDADAVILIDYTEGVPTALFFEAKVKTHYKTHWLIENEFNNFCKRIENKEKVESSNLFTQFFHKIKMVDALKKDKNYFKDKDAAVSFPKSSTKTDRKIGKNPVIKDQMIDKIKDYIDSSYYIAILPDSYDNINNFFLNVFKKEKPDEKEYATLYDNKFGFVTWKSISDFAKKQNLPNLLEVFKFNKGQIFKEEE